MRERAYRSVGCTQKMRAEREARNRLKSFNRCSKINVPALRRSDNYLVNA
jgi:hypothetical protein